MRGTGKEHTPRDAAGAADEFMFQIERAIYWLLFQPA
jgi:hypothetical protein